jgi:hypothetical protein
MAATIHWGKRQKSKTQTPKKFQQPMPGVLATLTRLDLGLGSLAIPF